jgi:serine/threonine protein kinase
MSTTILDHHGDGRKDARDERIRALFARAADLPEPEWEPFLLRECPDDADLRDEVLRILRGRRQAGVEGFLDWPEDAEPTDDPRHIGKYQVVRRLSAEHTGQAVAFLAFDPDGQRHVVIKRYHDGGDPQATAEEARALVRVSSPYVARCYGVERVGGEGACLVVEYVPGCSLAESSEEDLLDPARAARIVAQLAEGVAAVHACGLIHRDIKPANVILHDDGAPRLVDFGLAAHPGSDRLRGPSGSPPYMAPEQARREWDRIDYRTDVYGLGAVLYELLTGHPPHEGKERPEVIARAGVGRVIPPREWNPRIPRRLGAACLKALSPAPENRFATAEAFGEELRRCVRPRRGRLLGLTGLALIGAIAIVWLFLRPPPTPEAALLDGELTVWVWSLEGDGSKRGLSAAEPGALPVRNGEQVHLTARLNRPAFTYVVWIGSGGKPEVLHPSDKATVQNRTPELVVDCPQKLDQGYPMAGKSGLETGLLLARSDPLPTDVDLAGLIGQLPPVPLANPLERQVWKLAPGQAEPLMLASQFRSLDTSQTQQINDPLLQLLERLRPHFELIHVIRFAHQGNDLEPPTVESEGH